MLDLRLLREQPEVIREAIRRRGLTLSLDALLELEQTRRTLIGTIEGARQALKRGSEEFARQKTKGLAAPPATLKQLSDQIAQDEQQLRAVEEEIVSKLSYVPNIPHESVPSGDASHNQVVRTHGTPSTFSFSPKTHMELGAALGLLDLERAAKIAGSHFPLFIDRGARLVRVLIQWMLDVQTKEHGYTEVWPPALVNRASMFGTGQLPKFEEDMYRLKDDDLFLCLGLFYKDVSLNNA